MSDTIIKVEGLSKSYWIKHQAAGRGSRGPGYERFSEVLMDVLKAPFRHRKNPAEAAATREEFWALKEVSFEVKRGDVLGIIGRNGAGKSTLLKILARITEPTSGRIEIDGRVASLLEVGTGFHPELTGRENVFLNGAVLGMSRVEIKRKFDEIVAFAEVEQFLDTPVKRYSSGMYVRLAFAVAAHLEPEILIVDEVLAVGDAQFQQKCLGKMSSVASEGRTILFVSHNIVAVEHLCTSAILLKQGRVTASGRTDAVVRHYLGSEVNLSDVNRLQAAPRSGTGQIRFTSFHLEDTEGKALGSAASGMDVILVFAYTCACLVPLENVDIGFSLHNHFDQTLSVLYSSYVGHTFVVAQGTGVFRCLLRRLPLPPGQYRVGARITVNGEEADWPVEGVGFLEINLGDFFHTGHRGFDGSVAFLMDGSWALQPSTHSAKP